MDLADAHVHIFANGIAGRYGRACSGGADLEIYQSFRDEHQIDVARVIGYEGEPEHRGNNEYVALLAANNHWIVPVAFTPTEARWCRPSPSPASRCIYPRRMTRAGSRGGHPRSCRDCRASR